MRVECRPCLAVDALSALTLGKRCRRSIPAVRRMVISATEGLSSKMDPWTLSTMLTGHLLLKEIERMSLSELTELMPGWMRECEPLTGYADDVATGLRAFQRFGFETMYTEQCLPTLSEWSERLTNDLHGLPMDAMRADMDALCPDKAGDSLRIYVSYFSFPNTYLLSDRVLVASCRMGGRMEPGPLLERLVHEMLHGTIPVQVLCAYEALCASDPFLAQTRQVQSERLAGLVEEEFVAGLSQYVAASHGLYSDDQALRELGAASDYSMPVATVLFDALRRFGAVPSDVEGWLARFMRELAQNGVRASVECVSPGYARCFERVNRRTEPVPVRSLFL